MLPVRIALVGLGKIARDEHVPAIRSNPDFELAFAVDPAAGGGEPFPVFSSIEAALDSSLPFEAASICTPPQLRLAVCEQLLRTNCALLLEKPPAATLEEAQSIVSRVRADGRVLFAAWHSRFSPHIALVRDWARTHTLRRGSIEWRENAMKWHPGQGWLWQPGGFGVFDPGINALSILTAVFPADWNVRDPRLQVPANAATPVAADFVLTSGNAAVEVAFEFHQGTEDIWTLCLEAANGDKLKLSDGGAVLWIGEDAEPVIAHGKEYTAVYERFSELIRSGETDFDLAPLKIVNQVLRSAQIVRARPVQY